MISVNVSFDLSKYPVSFVESQLSFNGDTIKAHYDTMTQADIQLYIYAQFVDFAYMISYGTCIFLLGIYLGRKFQEKSTPRFVSYSIGLMGPVALGCDMVENMFILAMASNPTGFPNWYAITHSIFASIKFTFLFAAFFGLILLGFYFLSHQYRSKHTNQSMP